VTNEVGDVIHRRVFEPFGKVIAQTPSPPEGTDQLYTGQELEASTGLYDFKARWYDPEAGRFMSVDPVVPAVWDPQSTNPYTYVLNNPVSFVDPTGMYFTLALNLGGLGFAADYQPPQPDFGCLIGWVLREGAKAHLYNAMKQFSAFLDQVVKVVEFSKRLGNAM
jgi:RHS repeat-associated protein